VPRCGFDFERAYGELGRGYAHVHHKRPLSERDGDEVTRLEDLAVVCANCHAMIHLGNQCRPLDALIRDHQ
jgi:predicted HNH restriction endonuclease